MNNQIRESIASSKCLLIQLPSNESWCLAGKLNSTEVREERGWGRKLLYFRVLHHVMPYGIKLPKGHNQDIIKELDKMVKRDPGMSEGKIAREVGRK